MKPVALLLGSYRSEVLGLLFVRSEESFYVREIARLTGVPAGSLHRELKLLLEAGLLEREQQGNQVRYRANRANPIYPELAAIFKKTTGLAEILREGLKPLGRKVELAFVFGSIAQGTERSASDIDVFVVGLASFADVVDALSPLQGRLGRDINPVVMTPEQVAQGFKDNEPFLQQVADDAKIFLIGTEDDFGQLGRDRAA